jgi:hypothetical protein
MSCNPSERIARCLEKAKKRKLSRQGPTYSLGFPFFTWEKNILVRPVTSPSIPIQVSTPNTPDQASTSGQVVGYGQQTPQPTYTGHMSLMAFPRDMSSSNRHHRLGIHMVQRGIRFSPTSVPLSSKFLELLPNYIALLFSAMKA